MLRDKFAQVKRLHTGYARPVASLAPSACCDACGLPLVAIADGAASMAGGVGGGGGAGGKARVGGGEDGTGDMMGAAVPGGVLASGAVAVFACGHAYHQLKCLRSQETACPRCEQKAVEDADDDGSGSAGAATSGAAGSSRRTLRSGSARGGPGGVGAGGGSARDRSRTLTMGARSGRRSLMGGGGGGAFDSSQGAAAGDDHDDMEGAARVNAMLERVGQQMATSTVGGGSGGGGGDDADADGADDPHMTRLVAMRESRRTTRPLAEMFTDLSTAPSTMQVRDIGLRTAPARRPDRPLRRLQPALRDNSQLLHPIATGTIDGSLDSGLF